jgi:lipoprotein-anchoring transpeptidase ErfK/SrfK
MADDHTTPVELPQQRTDSVALTPGGTINTDPPAELADAGGRHAAPPTPRPLSPVFVALAVLAMLVAIILLAINAPSTTPPPIDTPSPSVSSDGNEPVLPVAAQPLNAAELAALPQESTDVEIRSAPADPAPQQRPTGLLLHPQSTVALYAAPGGLPFAALPATQLGADTWVPVINQQPGWAQVLLPGRPNGSTGWLVEQGLDEATTPYLLMVHRANFTLDLLRDGAPIHHWTIGVGKPISPTPPGRAYILAALADLKPTFSPVILPLSVHSGVYTHYSGTIGTIGIHTWPTATVFGTPSSDGCIRVPADALQVLSTQVPLGTPVLIS